MSETITQNIHIPVMMKEVLEALSPKPGDFIIDGTLGGGGHARELIKTISPNGRFLGVDRDPFVMGKTKLDSSDVQIILVSANYVKLPEILKSKELPLADGLLLDLGFSSNQLNEGRGFSFQKDEPLLMTYTDDDEPLYRLLRQLSKDELKEIISVSGERYARQLAEAIWRAERKNPIDTTGELVEVIRSALPPRYEHGRINPATRTFLAFRIYANKELENLEGVIDMLPNVLKPGGKVAIITFQSLEDGIVKRKFKEMEKSGAISILTKKPLAPEHAEVKKNPRARSAKLRVAKINQK
jgi:16S rRNA (cytosine1402-N4)-methyltransferase